MRHFHHAKRPPAKSAQMKQSRGHVEFIDGFEYYKLPDGNLIRAKIAEPIASDGRRPGQFVTRGSGIPLALRFARVAAGLPETRVRSVGAARSALDSFAKLVD